MGSLQKPFRLRLILSIAAALLVGILGYAIIASRAAQNPSADLNGDQQVNILDLSNLLSTWNQTGTRNSDINKDNIVNVLDLSILLASWGPIQATPITNLPVQPAALFYDDDYTNASSYAMPGALVVAGRDNYQNQAFKNISAGGGTTIIYIDPIIDNSYGRYHELLLLDSACGPAVPRWPGSPQANEWGYLNDFRVGGVLQSKLECVLEQMVAENPHMAGWFVDDTGSRSWFPLINWDSWSSADQQAYRDGAIEVVKTFRKVADKYKLFVMVNGTWGAGTLAAGGGYPDMAQHGNALADGFFVENHTASESIPYWTAHLCSTQWASQSTTTNGKPFHFTINKNNTDRDTYAGIGCVAYAATQPDYGLAPVPYTSFHPTGLPSKVSYSSACSATPGAGAGATTKGQTTYNAVGTTTVSNVIFDGNHSDDLVRVYSGHVIFKNVTFRGDGTGATGHTLEIKQGGSAEIRNSVFEGSPTEDTIQTQDNDAVLIECNRIGGSPGEDHIDTKPGGSVTIRNNSFTNDATYKTIQNHNGEGLVHTIRNTGVDEIFYELADGLDPDLYETSGTIIGNQVKTNIWLYDVKNVLVEGNTVPQVKHGDSTGRVPAATYFNSNNITTFSFNGGTCYKTGNSGASLSQCSASVPSWY